MSCRFVVDGVWPLTTVTVRPAGRTSSRRARYSPGYNNSHVTRQNSRCPAKHAHSARRARAATAAATASVGYVSSRTSSPLRFQRSRTLKVRTFIYRRLQGIRQVNTLTGKPEQQRHTMRRMRSSVLISISSRQRGAISGHPLLPEPTDF